MTTTSTTPATAPARRGFLALLTGAASIPAAALTATTATTVPPAVAEAPEILAIGDELHAVAAALADAIDRRDAALATFNRLRPILPPELIERPADSSYQLAEAAWGLAARALKADGDPRRIYRWRRVQAHIVLYGIPSRTKEGRRLRNLARSARAYETGIDKAIRLSGFEAAERLLSSVFADIGRLLARAHPIKPRTMAGVIICARLSAVKVQVERELDLQCRAETYADDVVASLLSIATVAPHA